MHRDNYTCQYCGKKSELTIDHIIPRSRGGKDEWDNVAVACLRCNVSKGARTPKEAGMTLKKPARRPKNFMNFEVEKRKRQGQGRVRSDLNYWEKYLFYK